MATPWQKVFARFGLKPAELAAAIGRDRSKIARHLNDDKGLISGRDQELLLAAAKDRGIELDPHDLLPVE